jgi:hypothetical protein
LISHPHYEWTGWLSNNTESKTPNFGYCLSSVEQFLISKLLNGDNAVISFSFSGNFGEEV